jgi:hypothetical protein
MKCAIASAIRGQHAPPAHVPTGSPARTSAPRSAFAWGNASTRDPIAFNPVPPEQNEGSCSPADWLHPSGAGSRRPSARSSASRLIATTEQVASAVGEASLGFRLEIGGTVVALLGRGIHKSTDEGTLEDLVSLGPIHTIVCEAVSSIGAVVRAMRILEPEHVLFYRGHDPYGRGRRSLAMRDADVPVSAYVEALAEDGTTGDCRVLKAGDNHTLSAGGPSVSQETAQN